MKEHVLNTFKELGLDMAGHANDKTLFQHSCNVSALLRSLQEPDSLCDAGFFHSIYGRQGTQFIPVEISNRQKIASVIGIEAELICYLNCASDGVSFWRNFHLRQELSRKSQEPQLFDRFSKTKMDVSWKNLTDILRLNFANMYDHIDFNRPIELFKWTEMSLYLEFIDFLSDSEQDLFMQTFKINEVKK